MIMEKGNIRKTYANGEVTVVWQSGKCVHCGNCARGLPAVFKPGQKPWVKIDGAPTSEIIEAVKRCPSGALSILGS